MTQFLDYDGAEWQLNDAQKKFFEEMEKELEQPITVIYGKGGHRSLTDKMEGIIFFDYATNSDAPKPCRCDAISRRNKTTIQLTNHFLLKPDDKREHIFDFNGFPLAEIRLFALWGLTPLNNFVGKTAKDTDALMREFWSDALRMSTKEAFFREKEEAKKREIQTAFLAAMKAANEGEVIREQAAIQTNATTLADLNEQLVSTHTAMLRAEQRLEIARKLAEGDQETYEKEIASLMKHKQIEKIDYDSGAGVLEIFTSVIYIHSPDESERSMLGKFLIKMNTKKHNSVTLFNLTNKRASKMHPHVESNGNACWGAIGTQIAKLAASCQVEGLADLVVRYLETYNVQDGNAASARLWFTEKDTEREREEFDNRWMTNQEYQNALVEKKAEEKTKTEVKAEKKEQVVDTATITDPVTEGIVR